MTDPGLFKGAVPDVYERLLVPIVFEPYAAEMARRAAALAPAAVLEIAAGTGAATRELDARLAPATRIVATDLSPGMIEIAVARQGGSGRVEWQTADAMALPFADSSFDLVVCQFGVMLFPDRVAAYREVKRVLKPGGTFLFAAWDSLGANELPLAVTEAVNAVFPDDPILFLERVPYGYFDHERIRGDLAAAGFGGIFIETVPLEGTAASAWHAAAAHCQGTPLRGELEQRAPGRLDDMTAKVAAALATRFGEGPFRVSLSAVIGSARRPA